MSNETSPRSVQFNSNGISISGNLYLPTIGGSSQDGSAIIVSHPTFGVKEQTAANYARYLSDRGFICLTYDAAYQGESGGLPRGLEDPAQRVEDARAAVSYLVTRPEVNTESIGALGICASGGYIALAAQSDTRMKAVATVSAADFPSIMREGIPPDGLLPREKLIEQLRAANTARSSEARGGKIQMATIVPDTLAEDAPQPEREVWDYYRTQRGAHPRAILEWPVQSFDRCVHLDAFRLNDLIAPRPLLMIVGSRAHTKIFSERGVQLAWEPKELYVIEGKSHYDLYDDLSQSGPKLIRFFAEKLAL